MKLYLDTSVFGGYYDDEFSRVTRILFDEILIGKHSILISDITLRELEKSPEKVKSLLAKIKHVDVEFVNGDKNTEHLAKNYISEKVVTEKYFLDAYHIAIATINRVDVLVSWNFKHMVNLLKIKSYNSVNLKYGYGIIDIRSPQEIIDEND